MLETVDRKRQSDMPDAIARLGLALVAEGILPEASLRRAERAAEETGERLDRVLSRLGLVEDASITTALANATGLPLIEATAFPDEPPLIMELGPMFLRQARILPLSDEGSVHLAVADPLDRTAVSSISLKLQSEVVLSIARPADIDAALERALSMQDAPQDLPDAEGTAADIARLRDLASEAPVIKIVNQIIQRAALARASDIHIDAIEHGLRVRLRVDGALQEIDAPPPALRAAILSRIKIMARMDIAEQRLPQDGRIKATVSGKSLDLRVATLPVLHGENVVMRLLDRSNLVLDFEGLGLDGRQREQLEQLIHRPNGIVLVTGPTGSGKTTTLYAALSRLNAPERKIITIEDPVEYQINGISQIQTKPQIGMDFAQGLRAILRHNPDVIMVGEIRDRETAEIAVQAALTGHLVLSTLHTNSAAAAIDRLRDMGVDDYLITATVAGVVAQRLVRRLCPECASPEADEIVHAFATVPGRYRTARGCAACNGTGIRGRSAILEILSLDPALRRAVLDRADLHSVEALALDGGMIPMHAHAMQRAAIGEISLNDVAALSVGQ